MQVSESVEAIIQTPSLDFDTTWNNIKPDLIAVLSGLPRSISNDKWLELYNDIYKICTQSGSTQGENLYIRLKDLMIADVQESLSKLEKIDGDAAFLQCYCQYFQAYVRGTNGITELFQYLNRYWIKFSHCEKGQDPIDGVYHTTELARIIWNEIAFEKLKTRIVDSINSVYRQARDEKDEIFENGDIVARTVDTFFTRGLPKAFQMKVYQEELEKPFLQDTAAYYSMISNKLLSSLNISDYLKQAEILCRQEQFRCDLRLHQTTVPQARQTCCSKLIDDHITIICDAAELFLVKNETENLHRVFSLFSSLRGEQALAAFKAVLKKYIEQKGLEVVRNLEKHDANKQPEAYVEALVEVRNTYYNLIQESFGSHPLMRTALDQACRSFANSHSKLPELLAKYSQYLLTREVTISGNSHVGDKINNYGVVFGLIDDKDIFLKHYAKYLAKRLIQRTSVSNDLELLLLQKLREVCGGDFVYKLQKMLQDHTTSRAAIDDFQEWMYTNQTELCNDDEIPHASTAIALHRQIAYNNDILTAGAWPISSSEIEQGLHLPDNMKAHIQLFTKFYTERYNGRKLNWVHQLSHGLIQAHGFDRRYEFTVSVYQMLILLLFNNAKNISEVDLVRELNIPSSDVIHHVNSLVSAKLLILSGTGSDRSYTVNDSFTNRKFRIPLIPKALVESKKNCHAAEREVQEDRKMAIQAAIVRVLKTRREISQSQLQIEVIEVLKNQFIPTVAIMKQNIEILIQKEYLKRHDTNPMQLIYIA